MGLPPLPPNPQAAMGSQGGVIVPPTGLSAVRPRVGPQLTQGILQAIQGFWAGKQAREGHFTEEANKMIQQKMLGLPVNDEKLLKAMRKSGDYKNLQFEPPSPQEQQVQQANSQSSQLAAMPGAGAPGQPGPPGMPAMAAQAPSAMPPPSPTAPLSLLQRMKQGMGFFPQPSMQSPAGNFIQQLGQAGQTSGGLIGKLMAGGRSENLQRMLESLNGQEQMQAHGLALSAMQGDPKAQEMMASIMGKWDLPADQMRRLFRAMAPPGTPPEVIDSQAAQLEMMSRLGIPQIRMKAGEMAKDFLPRMSSIPAAQRGNAAFATAYQMLTGQNVTTPLDMTTEDNKNNQEATSKYGSLYPNAPAWVLKLFGEADQMGPAAQSLRDQILKMDDGKGNNPILGPRDGTQSMFKWSQEFGLNKNTSWARIANEIQRTQTEAWSAWQNQVGEEGKPLVETMMQGPSGPQGLAAYNNAVQGYAGLMARKGTIPLKIGNVNTALPPMSTDQINDYFSKGKGMGPFGYSQNTLSMPAASPSDVSQFTGQGQQKQSGQISLDDMMNWTDQLRQLTPAQRSLIYQRMNPNKNPQMDQFLQNIEGIARKHPQAVNSNPQPGDQGTFPMGQPDAAPQFPGQQAPNLTQTGQDPNTAKLPFFGQQPNQN